ncbi:hypothetical protein Btru_027345 [Bulinus truncatus]|nr:hypothetical protein Btru_027345 [Bulinus truncatus]
MCENGRSPKVNELKFILFQTWKGRNQSTGPKLKSTHNFFPTHSEAGLSKFELLVAAHSGVNCARLLEDVMVGPWLISNFVTYKGLGEEDVLLEQSSLDSLGESSIQEDSRAS